MKYLSEYWGFEDYEGFFPGKYPAPSPVISKAAIFAWGGLHKATVRFDNCILD